LDTTPDTGLAKYSSTLPNVVFAGDNVSYCTTSGADEIKKAIDENQINRIVVAA
jgi:heterodisulfide reductase subunit A-like polyferredoxin